MRQWLSWAHRMVVAVCSSGLLAGLSGCAGTPPAAAETGLTRQPDEPAYVASLSDSQQAEVRSAFESLAAGSGAVTRPVPAERGRWSDVYSAVLYACDDVEMAVVSRKHQKADSEGYGAGVGERWEFGLRTVEDWPGTFIVDRVADAADSDAPIYRATAMIGQFKDRTDRAQALLDAFERQLRLFGRKPRLPE